MPAGVLAAVVMLKANSFASLANSASGHTVLAGKLISFTFGGPANGVVVVSLQNTCTGLPCSAAARSIATCTNGGDTSSVKSCDDTQAGPLPASAVAINAVFHFRTCAPPLAFTKNSASLCPSAIVTAFDEPTPRGLHCG